MVLVQEGLRESLGWSVDEMKFMFVGLPDKKPLFSKSLRQETFIFQVSQISEDFFYFIRRQCKEPQLMK